MFRTERSVSASIVREELMEENISEYKDGKLLYPHLSVGES